MAKPLPTEVKVGLFVIITVFALAYLSIRINKAGFSLRETKTIYINFSSASGLLVRTPVEFAGIRVGYVESIDLVNSKARVQVKLDPKVPVYKDSFIAIGNRGILGEKIITIAGGGKEPELSDGGIIESTSSGGGMDEALHNFNEVANAIKELIKGGDGKPSLKDIISNVNDVTEDLRTIVRGNKNNMDQIIHNVNEFTTMLNDGDLKKIITNLKSTSETVKTFVADANPQLTDVVKDFKTVMTKIDSTVESLNRIVAKVERGEGTVGKLLSDETTVNKVNDALDGINEFVGRAKRLEVAVGYRGEYLSSASRMQSVASFRIQPNYDKYFLFEFTDGPISYSKRDTTVTTSTTNPPGTTFVKTDVKQSDNFSFTALLARRFYDLTLKAGLIRSSGGFGAEYFFFHDRLSLGFDAFDFARDNGFHFRAYGSAHFFNLINVSAGADDLLYRHHGKNYFAGAGLMLTDNDLKALLGIAPLVSGR